MNEGLHALFQADRAERADQPRAGTPEYAAMRERDARRRQRAAAIVAAGGATTAGDYYHAAALFQHGDTPDDAWQAHTLALRAVQLGHATARWLAAAAYDRWCMYQGRPQKYGTNYVSDGVRHRLWDVDPATTDAERAEWDVPPLAEQLRKAAEATRIDPPPPIDLDRAPWWLKEALARWEMLEPKETIMSTAANTMNGDDPFNLRRFLQAQEPVYGQVLAELRGGQKRTHWMWFILPQIAGLGHSATSKYYAIQSGEEARRYLDHAILGKRLVECAETLLSVKGRSAAQIFGSPDDLKLRSSMTLFAAVAGPDSVFSRVLDTYYQGRTDSRTLELLSEKPSE